MGTVDNYDYAFYWYFYQDGSWEHEVKATGIVQTIAIGDGDPQITRHKIAPQLGAVIPQHFFSVRLDMEVDGGPNTVYEIDTVPLPRGPENPLGNAFTGRATAIADESESGRSVNSPSARHWRIANDSASNPLGQPPAYVLSPGATVSMMADERSSIGQRAQFARKQLWVTAYDPAQRYPAGDYPAQSEPGQGMPEWIRGRALAPRRRCRALAHRRRQPHCAAGGVADRLRAPRRFQAPPLGLLRPQPSPRCPGAQPLRPRDQHGSPALRQRPQLNPPPRLCASRHDTPARHPAGNQA